MEWPVVINQRVEEEKGAVEPSRRGGSMSQGNVQKEKDGMLAIEGHRHCVFTGATVCLHLHQLTFLGDCQNSPSLV